MGCGGLNQTHKHLQNPQYGICVVATRHPCRSIWWLVQRFYYPWSIRRISRKVGNHEKQAVECGPSSFPLVFNGQNMVVYPIFRYTHTHVFVSYCWLHTYIFSHTCIYIYMYTYIHIIHAYAQTLCLAVASNVMKHIFPKDPAQRTRIYFWPK